MGRPSRIQFPGACYSVTLRGNNRQDIFVNNADRRFFLSLLKSYKERYELKIYAYCLLAAGVELVVETAQPNLSKAMQGFNTAYTKYFNRQHGTAGHVFQGRYQALLVDAEPYLLEVSCRVHLAPARLGLRETPWRYAWSSCRAYVEAEHREPLVDSEPVLRRLAKSRLKQSVLYLHELKRRMRQTPQELPRLRGVFVGGEAFAAAAQRRSASAPPPAPSEGAAKDILAEVIAKHGIDEEKLFGRSQWREVTSVRKEAIYRIWKEAKVGVTEIGRMFNRTPSAVSQLIRSVEFPKPSDN